jgi:hypothetical protein
VSCFAAVIRGGDATRFRMVGDECTGRLIAPTGSRTVVVRFSPGAAP